MPSSSGRLDLGRKGEDAALALYRQAGYALVARNWRCRLGELDLVLARSGIVVFCEVKTRRGSRLGAPFEAVTLAKQRKLRRLAQAFLAGSGLSSRPVRFDVASVEVEASSGNVGQGPAGGLSVELLEDAF